MKIKHKITGVLFEGTQEECKNKMEKEAIIQNKNGINICSSAYNIIN